MRNQAFFSSHRLFHFFFVALAWTHRQTYTQGLKNIRSTQLSAIKEYAFSFVFPLLFTLFCLHLRGSAVAVPVFGMFARLMEYTNLTTEQLRDTVCFFTSLGTLFFSSWHHVCSRIFHHLWKYLKWPAESDTLCLRWRTAVWRHVGKFSVNTADSLPKSRPEGDRRRDEETNPSPHIPTPLILLHRQIKVRGKIGERIYVWCMWREIIGYLNFTFSVCVCGGVFVCVCVCARTLMFVRLFVSALHA